jgi:hypothetical protein
VFPAIFLLPFLSTRAINRLRRPGAEKDTQEHDNRGNHATDKAAAVAAQGTHDAPEKAPSKRVASKKKGAPKAKKTARLPKPRLPPRAPKARGEDPGDDRPRQGVPPQTLWRPPNGRAHSVRGFISTASKKHGVKIESAKNEAGERSYKIAE